MINKLEEEEYREVLRSNIEKCEFEPKKLVRIAKSFSHDEIEQAKRLIREQAKREEKERFEYYLNWYKHEVEQTTYKKGECKVTEIYLPIPTHNKVLGNKEISMKAYGAILLESSYGGKIRNMNDRYIYAETLEQKMEELAAQISTSSKKVSTRTLRKYIKALSKCSIKILEPTTNFKGEIFYRLNYSVEEKYFGLIHDVALRKLINSYSENALRIYLVILYMCFEKIDRENERELVYQEVEIRQDFLCEKIGLKTSSRKIVTDCIEALAKGGFIRVRLEYCIISKIENGIVVKQTTPKYFYSISKNYLNKSHITR